MEQQSNTDWEIESAQPETSLAALWDHVLQNFDRTTAHDAFLDACVEQQNLAYAARCYRQISTATSKPASQELQQRHQLAAAQLEKLSGLAWSMLKSSAKPPPQFRHITTVVAAVLCAILLLAVGLAFRP